MATARDRAHEPVDTTLLDLFIAIASRDASTVAHMLDADPRLATAAVRVGATRQDAETYFLTDIRHYVYAGDTGLHIAAAADERATAEALVAKGASVRARNRRGAEPVHYAADGRPGDPTWDPAAQYTVIEHLIASGADAGARDNSGVAALHRAVRTRSSQAVRALLEHGAQPTDTDAKGKTVGAAAMSDWIRELLDAP